MCDVLNGVSFIHSCKILHRDLKPQNVLVNLKNEAKIADFGLARTFSNELRPYSQEVVTLWYRAPELLIGHAEYSWEIDIWSIGCILFETITGKVLFKASCPRSQLVVIFQLMGTPTADQLPQMRQVHLDPVDAPILPFESFLKTQGLDLLEIDLLRQCLQFQPSKRISAKKALSHPYFDDVI